MNMLSDEAPFTHEVKQLQIHWDGTQFLMRYIDNELGRQVAIDWIQSFILDLIQTINPGTVFQIKW